MSTKRTSRDSPLKPVTKPADRRGLPDCNADFTLFPLPFPSTPFPFLFLTSNLGQSTPFLAAHCTVMAVTNHSDGTATVASVWALFGLL